MRYSEAWKLVFELEKLTAHDEDKSQYDAFLSTALEERLRAKGVKTIIITGILSDLCCETPAREAFYQGFDVVVLDDVALLRMKNTTAPTWRTSNLALRICGRSMTLSSV
ncbi:hypothetical protein NEOLEDRAFT_1139527 [Neolentinus lepideus HHB14362 ss-1]|uniref:Isochorismatase-like domain-containing protein n=1 Tax=Neolentinus lepideus HHB14362 ss-1 TaxID=1314782 RepID=A0A165PS12_9AGAM|nr:hypothetical protein NEOLEDRAFT_1139527 [Neolentinus lepideus HHB14362 ss-1]